MGPLHQALQDSWPKYIVEASKPVTLSLTGEPDKRLFGGFRPKNGTRVSVNRSGLENARIADQLAEPAHNRLIGPRIVQVQLRGEKVEGLPGKIIVVGFVAFDQDTINGRDING